VVETTWLDMLGSAKLILNVCDVDFTKRNKETENKKMKKLVKVSIDDISLPEYFLKYYTETKDEFVTRVVLSTMLVFRARATCYHPAS